MSRSLSLSAYLALRRTGSGSAPAVVRPPRPNGPLVWVRAAEASQIDTIRALARRLQDDGDRVSFVVTCPNPAPDPTGERSFHIEHQPADSPAAARAFVDHWQPDLLLWMRGDLDPLLLSETDRLVIPRLLIDASSRGIDGTAGNWMPGMLRGLLDRFDRVLAATPEARLRLRKAGVADTRLELSGQLEEGTPVLGCSERERRDLAAGLGTRPVWLAADTPADEVALIAQAHSHASRRTHRLLLILDLRDPSHGPDTALQLREAGFEVAIRSDGQEPSEATQVYLADTTGELGLWYRLAPMTYLGGSLLGNCQRHPFEPARLGSAVLHGPSIQPHTSSFQRLASVGASRSVKSASDLGGAIETLLAPDKAAKMAHAAWEVTSAGAEATNRVIELIRDNLDKARR